MSLNCQMKCYPGREPRIPATPEFVGRNKFNIRTDRAEALLAASGAAADLAADFLPFEKVKGLLSAEHAKRIEGGKASHVPVADVAEAAQDFLDYLVLAWMHSEDGRDDLVPGCLERLAAWMEILDRPDVAGMLSDPAAYSPCGMPNLLRACGELGVPYPERLAEFAAGKQG